jgi:hypothetical protein
MASLTSSLESSLSSTINYNERETTTKVTLNPHTKKKEQNLKKKRKIERATKLEANPLSLNTRKRNKKRS